MPSPNIILILTDHFRPDALTQVNTPHLMELASAGTQFTNAYCAAPLCQPSRCSIITGQYPSQHGVCGNQSPQMADYLKSDTFMRRLQRAGYYTALVGKHHYIDRYGIGMNVIDDDETIRSYGFDTVLQVADDGENRHNDDRYTEYLAKKGILEEFRRDFADGVKRFRHPFDEEDTADGFIGSNGIRFVEEYAVEKPFYLNLSFVGPHPPYWHPGELTIDPAGMIPPLGAPDSERVRTTRAHYLEKCRLIDRYVGRLRAALDARGMGKDTVIMFTSDHGDNLGDFDIFDKRYFYEQSCGVPLVMAGPGVPSGERMNGPRVSKSLVSHIDFYQTILALAHVRTEHTEVNRPESFRNGKSIIPMVDGMPESRREAVFAELATAVMIRTAGWKLVFDPEQGGVVNLYNLHNDPNELHNLAGVCGYEEITSRLVEKILTHRIHLTQFTHVKEEQRLQSVRIR
jgi:arylsulfatase A-like enzyme